MVNIHIVVLQIMIPYSLVDGTNVLEGHSASIFRVSADGGSVFRRNSVHIIRRHDVKIPLHHTCVGLFVVNLLRV